MNTQMNNCDGKKGAPTGLSVVMKMEMPYIVGISLVLNLGIFSFSS